MRTRRYGIELVLAMLLGFACLGCEARQGSLDHATGSPSTSTTPTRSTIQPNDRASTTVRIAAFNIQVFGQSKLDKPDAMRVLAQIARRYDVLAIQEIRSREQDVLPRFVELINSLDTASDRTRGGTYDFVIGPRLGRTSSKEQYAYVYDTSRVELLPNSVYTVADPLDLLHRPPLVAGFRTRVGESAFTFTLINIHTDPDETDTELDALDDVYQAVVQDGRREDDVILLGDLNVSSSKLGQLGQVPGITWTVDGEPTNTRRSKSYDNILFDRHRTSEFTGRAGVLDFLSEFRLTMEQALEVSDHFPVWAEFTATEASGPYIATRPER